MLSKVHNVVRRARVWLAAWVAPAGVDVHDTQATLCTCQQGLLELVCFQWLRLGSYEGEVLAPVNYMLDELMLLGAVTDDGFGSYKLTRWGEEELARMWGPETAPPWSSAWSKCGDHGIFETFPGDPINCPDCPEKTIIETARPWWSWMLRGRMSRYPL